MQQVRQAELNNRNQTWYCSQVLSYYQLLGQGFPLYSYCNTKDNLFVSQITLPDGRVFHGDFCRMPNEAAETAAKKVYKVFMNMIEIKNLIMRCKNNNY